MRLLMSVDFDDTTQNWELWGKLVEGWIRGIVPLPKDVNSLVSQGKERNISNFSVPGAQDRNVVFSWYNEKVVSFWLPTEEMLTDGRERIKPGPYPLPAFYDEFYEGKRRDLTAEKDTFLAACRVGEYTINICG
jgi:hypothetical protein